MHSCRAKNAQKEHELNGQGMGDIWRREGENDNTWMEVANGVQIVNVEMEANMTERISLALYNELKLVWKEKIT
jgi:hypothetical protein